MFCRHRHKGQRVWGPRLTPMWTVRRMPKGFCGPWSRLARDQVQDMHRVYRWSLPYPPSVVIVGGIPSCVSFGGMQLVWHLAELASEERVRLLLMSSLHSTCTNQALLPHFFFELCCARHYNCGSHWAVLVLSLLDNEIKRKGQGPRKTRQTKPQNNTQKPKNNPSLTNRVKGETRWNKLRLSRQTTIPGSHNVFSRK